MTSLNPAPVPSPVVLHPSVLFIIERLIIWVLAIAAGVALLVVSHNKYVHYVSYALFVIPGLFVLAADIRRRCITLQLDIGGIHMRRGVFDRKTTAIPLPRIASVDVNQGLLSRLLGVGEVTIHSNDASEDELFPSARHPGQLQDRITAMIQDHGAGLNQALS